jgi:hypothetical protein
MGILSKKESAGRGAAPHGALFIPANSVATSLTENYIYVIL